MSMLLSMCVLFYSSFVCISAYANVYSKTTIIKQNIKIILIAGVPKSQAAPVYLITAHHLCAFLCTNPTPTAQLRQLLFERNRTQTLLSCVHLRRFESPKNNHKFEGGKGPGLALLVHSRSYVNSRDSRSSIDSLLREIVTQ